MANLSNDVFHPQRIYETLFFNIKPVLMYQNLSDLEAHNKPLYDQWKEIVKTTYYTENNMNVNQQEIYEEHGICYPEFTKIAAITYATLYIENDVLKRDMKKIVDGNEWVVLSTFMSELSRISSDGVKSNPQYFPMLCGYDILKYDIPLLIKRFIYLRDGYEEKTQIPYILKYVLNLKPWESGVIDVNILWKFNGYGNRSAPLMLIADSLNLKKNQDLLSNSDASKKYWELIVENFDEALKFISLQSAIQTNFVIQIMNKLRNL